MLMRGRNELFDLLVRNSGPGPLHTGPLANNSSTAGRLPIRLFAYYLPQFHRIAENDQWWGAGFTEWTNVTKAPPRFQDHYQPRLPADLGFYSLSDSATLRQQAALARNYGLSGFCVHHYWFAGRRLLETPLRLLLANPDIDFPFFLNWANESWTRRWDGGDSDVLIEQRYSPDNDIAFAQSIEPALRDPRYLRIGGRPLLMIYRPQALPDARRTVARWREYYSSQGLGEPFIMMPQAFGDDDPRPYGIDAAVGFPPHKTGWHLPDIGRRFRKYDRNYRGRIMSYDALVRESLNNRNHPFTYFPGVCPGWDNHARKGSDGFAFVGATPQRYGEWLEGAARQAISAEDPDQRIVFVNAWNEWAEGAYLEPDRHFGHAFLAETWRVLSRLADNAQFLDRSVEKKANNE